MRLSTRLNSHRIRDDQIDPLAEHADESAEDEPEPTDITDGLQTFVFSATLSKDLQRNLKRQWRPKGGKKKKPFIRFRHMIYASADHLCIQYQMPGA